MQSGDPHRVDRNAFQIGSTEVRRGRVGKVRYTTLKSAVILAASVTIFGILLFSYLLQVSMPILKWGL